MNQFFNGNRCDYGHYGEAVAGACQPCQCDADGSISDECDEVTGQCNCKPGITGRDCTYCAPRHVISPQGCTCPFSSDFLCRFRFPSLDRSFQAR